VADARIDRGTVNLVFGRAIRLAEKTTTDFTDYTDFIFICETCETLALAGTQVPGFVVDKLNF
jgi:hypothetical protein